MVSGRRMFIPRPFSSPWDSAFRAASILHADEVPFRALLMAAMMKCQDPVERRILAWGFPALARYLSGRGHEMPAVPMPAAADLLQEIDLQDLAEQLREAMGTTGPAWAPAVIELIRRRHPDMWDDAVRSAKEIDQARMEL
jgi:hypothetical protein